MTEENKDEAARGDIYAEIQDILAEEVPGLYIQSSIGLRVTKENLTGLDTYPIDIIELKDVHFTE